MGQAPQPAVRLHDVLSSDYANNCEELLNEENVCLLYDGNPVVLGMNTKKICTYDQVLLSSGMGQNVWLGHYLYVCDHTLVRMNLLDGTIDIASDVICKGVYTQDGKLLVDQYLEEVSSDSK